MRHSEIGQTRNSTLFLKADRDGAGVPEIMMETSSTILNTAMLFCQRNCTKNAYDLSDPENHFLFFCFHFSGCSLFSKVDPIRFYL